MQGTRTRQGVLGAFFFCLVFMASWADATSLKDVAKKLAKGVFKTPDKTVAVLIFPYANGDLSSGSILVAERLTTLLAQDSKIQVVERSRLAELLGELRLEKSGMMEDVSSSQLGHLLGVDTVVMGTISDLKDVESEIDARLVETASGKILSADSARFTRTWTDQPKTPTTAEELAQQDNFGRMNEPYQLHASPIVLNASAGPSLQTVASASQSMDMVSPSPVPATPAAVPASDPVLIYGLGPLRRVHDHDDDHHHDRDRPAKNDKPKNPNAITTPALLVYQRYLGAKTTDPEKRAREAQMTLLQ